MAGPPQPPGSPPQPPGSPGTPPAPAPYTPAPAPYAPAPAPSGPAWGYGAPPPKPGTGGSSSGAIVAGLLALLGAVLSVAGTIVPVTTWGDDSQPPFAILPVLDGGNPINEFSWFALEPLGIALVVVLLGVSLVAMRKPRRAGGGALTAFGLTTVLAFSAYVLSSVLNESYGESYGPMPGPGSWLGILSGILLLFAGFLAIASAPRRTS